MKTDLDYSNKGRVEKTRKYVLLPNNVGERSQDRRESAKALFTSSKICFLETLKNHFFTPEKIFTLGVERAKLQMGECFITMRCTLCSVH